MNSNLKKGLFLVTLFGAISVPGEKAEAADEDASAMPGVGIEEVLNDCYAADGRLMWRVIWYQQKKVSI